MADEAFAAAAGGLLFSCLGRSGHWYQSNGMAPNFEPDAFADAFPDKALAGLALSLSLSLSLSLALSLSLPLSLSPPPPPPSRPAFPVSCSLFNSEFVS